MIVHELHGPPAPELARALAEFEAGFTYPLGPGRTFHICHGDDYPCFFRAMGEAACFVAEQKGRVFYMSHGHNEKVYANPVLLAHLLRGIQYALGDLAADDSPSVR